MLVFKMMRTWRCRLYVPMCIAIVACLPVVRVASASSLTLVTSRAAIGGTDSIDWGQLGAAISEVPNPSTVTSSGGLNAIVSKPTAAHGLSRVDQIAGGQPPSTPGWKGNFAVGDHLLTPFFGEAGPITIDFGSHLVAGGGVQINSENFDSTTQTFLPGPFTASVEAFDGTGTSLGTFTEVGNETYTANNTAIFIGVLSSQQNIRKLVFGVTQQLGNEPDFAINALSIADSPPANPAPTPLAACGGSALLSGLALVAAVRRRPRLDPSS